MVTDNDGDEDGGRGDIAVARRLDSLYRRYAGWLRQTLRSRLGAAPDEADDLVQEAYARIARYTAADSDRHPKALLLTIARNLLRDSRGRAAYRLAAAAPRMVELGELLPIEPDQAEQLLLKQVVLGIPQPYRDVFILSRFTAMGYEQIAAHLGISQKTVKRRMTKALEHCARQLRY